MDYGTLIGRSYEYTTEAVWGKWGKWVLLIISSIIFPLIMGYMMEIYRGRTPAPELKDWIKLFVDGVKLFIVELIYSIPLIIVALVFFGGAALAFYSGGGMTAAASATFIIGSIIFFVLAVLIGLVSIFAGIRLARTDRFGEAFNISAIIGHIGAVGWLYYLVALVIAYIIVWVVTFVLMLIPIVGGLILLIITPAISIFMARYVTLIYESVPVSE
ncbi:DUF4013 domain-containing protein [Methanofollis aquaemaris]|uniref:DUF4013 domain-containing protein n=1 Tax=Methanofollis aquaemaris TaxID=126734 RepID=A0A8A3S8D0_9EURY|nr:DUF4013 domain-containing protein [Methanofollis aquaemaris]QSZ68292.1 DUF4013 domain-containing protein [Methanofollis aquaemaris]